MVYNIGITINIIKEKSRVENKENINLDKLFAIDKLDEAIKPIKEYNEKMKEIHNKFNH